jgi:hypothetical protein
MNFVIKIFLIISITIANFTLANIEGDNFTQDTAAKAFDFNDTITKEIDNYNNSLASEILDDEHDSSKITSKDLSSKQKHLAKLDLKYSLLTVLNKITAKNESFFLEMNKFYKYKNIIIEASNCQKSESNEFEDRVLIKITEDDTKNNLSKELFSGWLLAKSSLTSLAHPIYDITLTECSAVAQ